MSTLRSSSTNTSTSLTPVEERGVGRVLLGLALAVALAIVSGAPARAQSAVEVSPPVLLHEGGTGGPVDGAFTVKNPSRVPLRVRVYLSDWHYRGDGTPNYLDPGSVPRSLASYVTFNPAELLLDPEESAEVRYTVDLPPDVDPGSYWGVIFMEGEDPDPEPGFKLANFNVRVGHVVYVDVPPLRRDGRITSIFGLPPGEPDGPYTLRIEYANIGNAIQKLDGYIELRDATGAVLLRDEMPAVVSLPGDAVWRTFDVYGPLDPGNYTALVVYNYGDETTDVAADYAFTLEEALAEPEAPVDPADPAADTDTATAAEEGP